MAAQVMQFPASPNKIAKEAEILWKYVRKGAAADVQRHLQDLQKSDPVLLASVLKVKDKKQQFTTLTYAAKTRKTEIAITLAAFGANPLENDRTGNNAFTYATKKKDLRLIRAMASGGFTPPDVCLNIIASAKHETRECIEVMEALIKAGARANHVTPYVKTWKRLFFDQPHGSAIDIALFNVTVMGRTEYQYIKLDFLEKLCANTDDINLKNSIGSTYLHRLCDYVRTPLEWAQFEKAVYILLDHGLDPNIRNIHGKTALDYSKKGFLEKLLREYEPQKTGNVAPAIEQQKASDVITDVKSPHEEWVVINSQIIEHTTISPDRTRAFSVTFNFSAQSCLSASRNLVNPAEAPATFSEKMTDYGDQSQIARAHAKLIEAGGNPPDISTTDRLAPSIKSRHI